MNKLDSTIGVKKIELLFAENIDFPSIDISQEKKSLIEKIRIKHLLWIPRLLFTRTYRALPKILKDIFFSLSIFINHQHQRCLQELDLMSFEY